MDGQLARVPRASSDPLGLTVIELDGEDARAERVGPEARIDNGLPSAEYGERVRADPELSDATRGSPTRVLRAMTARLIRGLPERSRTHQLRQPIARFGSGLA